MTPWASSPSTAPAAGFLDLQLGEEKLINKILINRNSAFNFQQTAWTEFNVQAVCSKQSKSCRLQAFFQNLINYLIDFACVENQFFVKLLLARFSFDLSWRTLLQLLFVLLGVRYFVFLQNWKSNSARLIFLSGN